jgi:hypothetical protein
MVHLFQFLDELRPESRFAVQDQSLRAIPVAGKASAAPRTAATVKES